MSAAQSQDQADNARHRAGQSDKCAEAERSALANYELVTGSKSKLVERKTARYCAAGFAR
jgi:hypothetical protein